MMRSVLRGVALALLLLGLAAPLVAQPTSGSVQGTVKDAQGAALPGVAVTAYSDALMARKITAYTDQGGVYRFPSLPVGSYVIEAELAGFASVRQEGIQVNLGRALAVDIMLPQAKLAETITVSAEAPVVSVVSNTVTSSFDTSFIDKQPLPRNYYAILSAAPGVTLAVGSTSSMMAYGGTSQTQNAYTLDGVNVANPLSGEYWLLPSIQWMEEIQIGGLGANAEYGGFTGGIVNGVTKSGGNEFHGAFEYYVTPSSWVSNNDPTGQQGEFKFTDVALSLGGKIVQDKLWWFLSGEYWDEVSTPVGALDNTDRKIPRYLGKLTWQADSGNRLMLMAEYDGLVQERRGISATTLAEASAHEESPNYTGAVSWESLINANNFINLKLTGFGGRLDYLPYHGFDTPGRIDDSSATDISWVNQDVRSQTYQRLTTFDASWTLFNDGLFGGNDSHSFKFGGSYEKGSGNEQYTDNGGFVYWDDSSQCESPEAYFADPSCGNYYIEYGYGNYHEWLQTTVLNLYAQDSMRLGRFTLNYGVRYGDLKGGFQEGHGNADVYNVNFVDPRIGLVWDLTGAARTVVKAHWGRYHQKMSGYLYDREISGNALPPTIDCYWNPDTSQFDECETYLEPTLATMGKYGHQYVDESLVTFEQQLGKNMLVGLDLVDRKYRDIIAMINTNDDYTLIEATGNPITGGTLPIYDLNSPQNYVLTTDNGAYRDYQAVMLRFEKRYSNGWLLNTSLVWTDLKGNQYKNNSYIYEFMDKNGYTNADGRPELTENEWAFKLSAAVDLPLNLILSGQYQYMSGMYWQPYVRVSGLDWNWHEGRDIKLVPRGSEKFPARNLIDLRLAWNAKLGKSMNLTLQAECFNVLNKSTMLNNYNRWGTYRLSRKTWSQSSTYGDPYTIEQPRQLRAGIRLQF